MTEVRTIKSLQLGNTHCVFFKREYKEDWGYMGMRDYPTWEATDVYEIAVVPYSKYTGVAHGSDAGYKKGSFSATGFDKDMANRIWWNVKNGISYETLKDAMTQYITMEA